MKGDFTRITFRPASHYSSVRLQQGRVQLDADWNEQIDIQAHRDQTATQDVVGLCGAPRTGGGFQIVTLYLKGIAVSPAFATDMRAWAVGDDGTIVVTTDGGKTWTKQMPPSGVTAHLRAVHFATSIRGWAVGDGGTILATANGGGKWDKQSSGVAERLRAVRFVNADRGWAVGDGGTILATTNGGVNWTKKQSGVATHLLGVHFANANHGWVAGDGGIILTTANGGVKWDKQLSGVSERLRAVYFKDANRGWAVGDGGTILVTANGGVKWDKQLSGVSERLRAVYFVDTNRGWAVGDNGTILATTDGGANWTEQLRGVTAHLRAVRFTGPNPGFVAGDSDTILVTNDGGKTWTKPTLPGGPPIYISSGRIYANGILCENKQDIPLTAQPDLPGTSLPTKQGTYLAYLDVWQRHLTALERPELREVALVGPDTATRTQTVWQVKLEGVDANSTCSQFDRNWTPPGTQSTGRLRTQAMPVADTGNACLVPAGAGYQRLENQLYRVEIHSPGSPGTATFKWSRDNGTVAARLEKIDGNTITVSDPGKDSVLEFAGDQWVELSDEERTLRGEPGSLVELKSVQGKMLVVKSWPNNTPLTMANFGAKPIVRRWDSLGAAPVSTVGWLDLEDGVQVEFAPGDYRTGDYWLIPARTLTADVEWPKDGTGPRFEERHGIQHHYCPLALLRLDGSTWTVQSDCRHIFPPITELTSLFYISGDGQEGRPGQKLPRPLQVGVANGQWPIAGAQVRFRVTIGNGGFSEGSNPIKALLIYTGANGVAECSWWLDAVSPSQQVEAILADGSHLPVRFNAACEPGIHITQVVVNTSQSPPLQNDMNLPLSSLKPGLRVECDVPIEPATVKQPTCFLTLDIPVSSKSSVGPVWGGPAIGFQRLILAATVKAEERAILWNPDVGMHSWLMGLFTKLVKELGDKRILARLTLKGNFIWAQQSAGNQALYLDGDIFGLRSTGALNTGLRFPSGDGWSGGDFEMWFWLTPPPTITVTPSSGPTGTTVTIAGSGYPPGATVTIKLAGQVVATATTDAQGNFSKSMMIPPGQSPGVKTITATAGEISASASYTVTTPSVITVTPSSGTPGTTVTLAGSGYPPGATVTIKLAGQVVATATADTQGNFSKSMMIPPGQSPGKKTITATAGEGISADAQFTAVIR